MHIIPAASNFAPVELSAWYEYDPKTQTIEDVFKCYEKKYGIKPTKCWQWNNQVWIEIDSELSRNDKEREEK